MLDSQYGRRQMPLDPSHNPIYTHSRTRTTSSNTFPTAVEPPRPAGYHPQQMHAHLVQPQGMHQRRTPSVNTFSTISSSSGTMVPPSAYRTSPTADVRRSTSSRSGGTPGSPQPTSYVALLRKQKATVWCDRAQYEDPRLVAQQRAAKVRANREIVGSSGYGLGIGGHGGPGSGRTSTGLSSTGGKVAAKIRHHGKPVVVGYSPENNYVGLGGGGVPMRLSATEVEGEDSDDDDVNSSGPGTAGMQRLHHRRTGSSGRSSTASGRRAGLTYRTSGGLGHSNSGGRRWSPGDTPERTGSLVEENEEHQHQYEPQQRQQLRLANPSPAENEDDDNDSRTRSVGSSNGGASERLDVVGDLGSARLASNSLHHAVLTREKSAQSPEELRRRGSVDERTMTLTAGRLFIANPD